MSNTTTYITIPKKITEIGELVILPRKEFEKLVKQKGGQKKEKVTEADVLRWSAEAKKLKKAGKLPLLRSLKEFR